MSFLDKLKALFSHGPSEHDHSHDGHDHSHEGHDHAHDAMDDVPPPPAAPLDPLGTTDPEPIPGEGDRST
jgi:hypothetical protein